LDGWTWWLAGQVNGILTLSIGEPVTFYPAQEHHVSYGGAQRRTPRYQSDLGGHAASRWFDTKQIVAPARVHLRQMARNSNVRSDNAKNVDFSIFKNFASLRGFSSAFAASIQLMNHPLFGAPNTHWDRYIRLVLSQENLLGRSS